MGSRVQQSIAQLCHHNAHPCPHRSTSQTGKRRDSSQLVLHGVHALRRDQGNYCNECCAAGRDDRNLQFTNHALTLGCGSQMVDGDLTRGRRTFPRFDPYGDGELALLLRLIECRSIPALPYSDQVIGSPGLRSLVSSPGGLSLRSLFGGPVFGFPRQCVKGRLVPAGTVRVLADIAAFAALQDVGKGRNSWTSVKAYCSFHASRCATEARARRPSL